jgi:GDP-L-galactose phosphorylase
VVLINVSPIDYGHVLLCPKVLDCIPQVGGQNAPRCG